MSISTLDEKIETIVNKYIKNLKNIPIFISNIKCSIVKLAKKKGIQPIKTSSEYNLFCNDVLYNIVHILQEKKPSDAIAEIKSFNLLWNDFKHSDLARDQEHEDKYMTEPLEVVPGVVSCPFCNSDKVIGHAKQTRGGDEGMTIFFRCTECNKSGKIYN